MRLRKTLAYREGEPRKPERVRKLGYSSVHESHHSELGAKEKHD